MWSHWVRIYLDHSLIIFSVVRFFDCCFDCLSDIVSTFGGDILPYISVTPLQNMLQLGRRSKSSQTRTVAHWATKEIKKLQNAAKAAGIEPQQFNDGANTGPSMLTTGGESVNAMKS